MGDVAMDQAVAPGAAKQESKQVAAFRVPGHVRMTHGPDGGTVLDILNGQMFRLNAVGSTILELTRHGSTAREIAEQLAREFRIDRVSAEDDVREFLETLEKHRLLTSPNNDNPA